MEHPSSAAAAAAVRAEALLDAHLAKGLERLKGETTIRSMTTLWDEVEQDLPPDSKQLNIWQDACMKRQEEIRAAAKK